MLICSIAVFFNLGPRGTQAYNPSDSVRKNLGNQPSFEHGDGSGTLLEYFSTSETGKKVHVDRVLDGAKYRVTLLNRNNLFNTWL